MERLSDVIAWIENQSGMTEVSEVTVLHGYLDSAEVEVTLRDRGENADPASTRWSVSARILDEQSLEDVLKDTTESGNAESTLQQAISVVKWKELRRRLNR